MSSQMVKHCMRYAANFQAQQNKHPQLHAHLSLKSLQIEATARVYLHEVEFVFRRFA
jgi:hypothetical protein